MHQPSRSHQQHLEGAGILQGIEGAADDVDLPDPGGRHAVDPNHQPNRQHDAEIPVLHGCACRCRRFGRDRQPVCGNSQDAGNQNRHFGQAENAAGTGRFSGDDQVQQIVGGEKQIVDRHEDIQDCKRPIGASDEQDGTATHRQQGAQVQNARILFRAEQGSDQNQQAAAQHQRQVDDEAAAILVRVCRRPSVIPGSGGAGPWPVIGKI